MKKKTTVLLALISMCLIVTAGIGAVSASDETPSAVIPVFKINPDGTTTVVETIEGSGPTVVTVTPNEDGSINITREDRQIGKDRRFCKYFMLQSNSMELSHRLGVLRSLIRR